jgi:hypothetical protein
MFWSLALSVDFLSVAIRDRTNRSIALDAINSKKKTASKLDEK